VWGLSTENQNAIDTDALSRGGTDFIPLSQIPG
jgi:hypothetical protein